MRSRSVSFAGYVGVILRPAGQRRHLRQVGPQQGQQQQQEDGRHQPRTGDRRQVRQQQAEHDAQRQGVRPGPADQGERAADGHAHRPSAGGGTRLAGDEAAVMGATGSTPPPPPAGPAARCRGFRGAFDVRDTPGQTACACPGASDSDPFERRRWPRYDPSWKRPN